MALVLPDDAFLDAVERDLDVLYPDSFRTLVREWRSGSVRVPAPPPLDDGRFVTSREELDALMMLCVGLLPFWFATSRRARRARRFPLGRRAQDTVVGFDIEAPMSDKVLLWSVHMVVHEYADVMGWLGDERRPR